jgi:F0F1-type ATP synthase membrane subunit c/vacuolar-type H+-ATPase subunit K
LEFSNGRYCRQPEASGKIQTAMLIKLLIEGIGFAAIQLN